MSKGDSGSNTYATKSLNALAKCLRDLKEVREGQNIHNSGNTWATTIPGRLPLYKEFKLTRILYEYFYENSNIRFINHLNVAPFDIEEAFKTINYTSQIKGNAPLCSSRFASVCKSNKDTMYKLLFANENASNNNSVSKLSAVEPLNTEQQTMMNDNLRALENLLPNLIGKLNSKILEGDLEFSQEDQANPQNQEDNIQVEKMAIEEELDDHKPQYEEIARQDKQDVSLEVNVTFTEHQFEASEEGYNVRTEKQDSLPKDKVVEQQWYTQSVACSEQKETLVEQQIDAAVIDMKVISTENRYVHQESHIDLQEEKAIMEEDNATNFKNEVIVANEAFLPENHVGEEEAKPEQEFDVQEHEHEQKSHPSENHETTLEQPLTTHQQEVNNYQQDQHVSENMSEQNTLQSQPSTAIVDQQEPTPS